MHIQFHINKNIESTNARSLFIIIPHKCEYRNEKNVARALLHSKRELKIQLCRHYTYMRLKKFTTTNYVDITEYVYLFQFPSFYFVSYGLVDIALTKVKTMLD